MKNQQLQKQNQSNVSLITQKAEEVSNRLQLVTLEEALESTPMSTLEKTIPAERILGQIFFEVKRASRMLNLNDQLTIKDEQLPEIAIMILEEFPHESLEDISLCMRRGCTGRYGKIYRFDIAIIFEWMRLYLFDKAEARERQLKLEKKVEVEKEMTAEELEEHNKKVIEILNAPDAWTSKKPKDDEDEYRKFKTQYAIKKTLENEKTDTGESGQPQGT